MLCIPRDRERQDFHPRRRRRRDQPPTRRRSGPTPRRRASSSPRSPRTSASRRSSRPRRSRRRRSNDFTVQAAIKGLKSGRAVLLPLLHLARRRRTRTRARPRRPAPRSPASRSAARRGTFETAPLVDPSRRRSASPTPATPTDAAARDRARRSSTTSRRLRGDDQREERLQHPLRRHDLLRLRASAACRRRSRSRRSGPSTRSTSAAQNLQTSAGRRASTATGTTTSSSTTSRFPRTARRSTTPACRRFTDYAPVSYTRQTGLYRSFRWGANIEIFFLDERSFRSAKASDGGVCDNPDTGSPDLAPTAPQSARNVFAALDPVARPAGLPAVPRHDQRPQPHDARQGAARPLHQRRQVLDGEVQDHRQRDADHAVLRRCRTTAGRATRTSASRCSDSLQDAGVKNLVFMTTDTHATSSTWSATHAQRRLGARPTLPPARRTAPTATTSPGPSRRTPTGTRSTRSRAPPATASPSRRPSSSPPPPTLGMACAQGDVYSYAEVEVSSARVTIAYKDENGKTVLDSAGTALRPVHDSRPVATAARLVRLGAR